MVEGDKSTKVFFNMGLHRSLRLYFCLNYLNVQLLDKILLIFGSELRFSGVGSDRFTN